MGKTGRSPDARRDRSLNAGRRRILAVGMAGLATTLAAPALARLGPACERRLALYNLHTGEKVRTTYWADGVWNLEGLREIDQVLRDFRTGEVRAIDRALLDLLDRLARTMETLQPFHVVSGYRSPRTNARLAAESGGVAKRSLHMRGMAIDLRLPGVDLEELRQAAVSLKAGGVGFYPRDNFIHVDTGRVRYW